MKILIFHPHLWSHYKAKIYSELQTLVNQHPNIELLVLQTAISEKSRSGMGAIDWSMHQYNVKLLFNQYSEEVSQWGRFKKGFHWIRQYRPDVVNFTGYFEPGMNLLMLYCFLKGIKVIISVDTTENDNPNVGWKEAIKRFLVKKANGLFCYGTKSAEYMLKLGAKPEAILSKNNAVDNLKIAEVYQQAVVSKNAKKQQLGLKPFNFIFVGRIIPLKNLLMVLKAFHALKAPDWGFIFVGDGDEKANLQQYIRDNRVENIHFFPSQIWQQIPNYLALADVLILASYSEAWGLVVNEAMICHLPVVVSTQCGCASDLVKEGENGYTFSPFNQDELAKKMQLIISKKAEELQKMGEVSANLIKHYAPEVVAREMFEGFVKVVRND